MLLLLLDCAEIDFLFKLGVRSWPFGWGMQWRFVKLILRWRFLWFAYLCIQKGGSHFFITVIFRGIYHTFLLWCIGTTYLWSVNLTIIWDFLALKLLKHRNHDWEFRPDVFLALHQGQIPAHILAYHVRDGQPKSQTGLVNFLIWDFSVRKQLKEFFLLRNRDPNAVIF